MSDHGGLGSRFGQNSLETSSSRASSIRLYIRETETTATF